MNETASPPKYFTPPIEDIRVGYECEIVDLDNNNFGKPTDKWQPYIVGKENAYDIGHKVFWADLKWVRVSYLTAEQIEKEGWEITHRETKKPPYQVDWINAKKGGYSLWINLALHKSMHLGIDKDGILFRGQCKDINAFRYICKLLNI